jgi:acylphosphatase
VRPEEDREGREERGSASESAEVTAETAANSIRRHVVYHGRVQGVFFRATSVELSQNFRVVGFVRNQSDGTVELEAQGLPVEVDGLLAAIANHFKHNITKAEIGDLAPRDDEGEFGVRY